MKNCSGSEDGGSKQGQRDLLEGLLARQHVEDQLAWALGLEQIPSSSIEMLRWIVLAN